MDRSRATSSQLLVLVLWALVLGRVVVSWVDPQGRNSDLAPGDRADGAVPRRRSGGCCPRPAGWTSRRSILMLVLARCSGSSAAERRGRASASPCASRRGAAPTAVDGVGEDGVLRVRVAAPPVEAAANEALCRLLARELGVARSGVRDRGRRDGPPEGRGGRRHRRAGGHDRAGPGWPYNPRARAISSAGQSARFTSVRSLVRTQYRPPDQPVCEPRAAPGRSAECHPVRPRGSRRSVGAAAPWSGLAVPAAGPHPGPD